MQPMFSFRRPNGMDWEVLAWCDGEVHTCTVDKRRELYMRGRFYKACDSVQLRGRTRLIEGKLYVQAVLRNGLPVPAGYLHSWFPDRFPASEPPAQ